MGKFHHFHQIKEVSLKEASVVVVVVVATQYPISVINLLP
jgi:hypothetical protein